MLSLRVTRRFRNFAAAVLLTHSPAAVSNLIQNQNQKPLEEPALLKLKAERDPEKLFNLFKANAENKLVVENRFAFEDTVSRLAGANRFDYIEHLLEHQKTLPQGRREGYMVRIIMLYGKAGMIEHAIDTFHNMHLRGCKRTVKSFNAALKVLTGTRDLATIETFVNEAPKKFDIEFDIFSVNIIVKALCERGVLDKSYLLMVEMEKSGVTPDVITYTTLTSAYYKNNKAEIGNGLWNLMVLKGCLPNLATFNVRIQYLVNIRRAWHANDVMRLMQKIGIVPDEVSYNLVLKGFFQVGHFEMAKLVYFSLRCKGHKFNVKVYQTMVHYLCKGGEFDLAYTMCRDCMRTNWFLNVDTIHTLLEGLKKNGQLNKAKLHLTKSSIAS
ncbi:pentatricopeptide repeat-containing protein At1g80150, mitochondrial isoform X1 [Populus trichocarpa]|uniref:pentatricopeptide repeat-containing protein At1g80150, mitochondrial isoform X1 n=1 Tax=Populus trichocarpa TaxID=3694 RepID=UPI0022793C66|nr:pentatricopeptide repeat-containing protein At1g80150, mitochondrial isoform X1 [Populus trichocarpa]